MSADSDETDALTTFLEDALRGAAESETNSAPLSSNIVVGEVVDTHHPHLPGRILVKWLSASGHPQQRWLEYERTVSARTGARVLLTRPCSWPDWIVFGVLGAAPRVAQADEDAVVLTLQPGQALQVRAHDGTPLLNVRLGDEGPSLELCGEIVELKAARKLTLSADTVEIRAAHGGVDVRTEGDAVVRGRFIRLN